MAETGGGLPPIANTEEDRIRQADSQPRSNRRRNWLTVGIATLIGAVGISYLASRDSYDNNKVQTSQPSPQPSQLEQIASTNTLPIETRTESSKKIQFSSDEVLINGMGYVAVPLAGDETIRILTQKEQLDRSLIHAVVLVPRDNCDILISDEQAKFTPRAPLETMAEVYGLVNIKLQDGEVTLNTSGALEKTIFVYSNEPIIKDSNPYSKAKRTTDFTIPEVEREIVNFGHGDLYTKESRMSLHPSAPARAFIQVEGSRDYTRVKLRLDGELTEHVVYGVAYMPFIAEVQKVKPKEHPVKRESPGYFSK